MIDDPETLAHRISDRTAARADRDAVLAELRTPIAVPAARSAALERRRGRDSSRSRRPPSRAGRARPTAAARCQRQRSRRRVDRRATPAARCAVPTLPTASRTALLMSARAVGQPGRPGCPSGLRPARVADRSVARLFPVQRRRPTRIDRIGVRMAQGAVLNRGTRAPEGRDDRARPIRDAVAPAPVTPRDATGGAIHDHGRPSVTSPGTGPALGAAHLLRERPDRVDVDNEDGAAPRARVRRRRDNRKGVLRPARDPAVPATHNEAERALRPLKGQQKISGRVRSTAGARNPAVLRTVLDTACKQGWTRLDTLRAPPEELVEQLVTRLPAQAG